MTIEHNLIGIVAVSMFARDTAQQTASKILAELEEQGYGRLNSAEPLPCNYKVSVEPFDVKAFKLIDKGDVCR